MDRSLAPIAVQAVDGPHISSLTLSLAKGDQRLVSRLLRAAGAREVGRAKALRSVYYDTRRKTLGRVGYRLSVRAQGNKRVQHIEPAGIVLILRATAGCTAEVEDGAPTRASVRATPLDDILSDRALARLKPLFDVDIRRRTFTLNRNGAGIVASLDIGTITAGIAVERICELRLELASGLPVALFELAREFCAKIPATLVLRSHGEKGFRLLYGLSGHVDADAADDVRGKMTIGAGTDRICQKWVVSLFDTLALLAADGGRDVLHRARIGLRRLRAILWFLRPALGPGVEGISERLRTFALFLGAARELDVFCDRVLTPLRLSNPDALGMDALIQTFEQRRRMAHDEVLAFARSPAMLEFGLGLLENLAELIRSHPSSAKDRHLHDLPLSEFVHARLARRLQTFLKAARKLDSCAPDTQHHIRVVVKKLRYAIEAFHSVIGAKTSRNLVTRLVQLQEVLGELNDARSSHAMVLTYAQDRAGDDRGGATLFAAGLAAAACNPDPGAALEKAAATRDELAAFAR